MLFNKFKTYYLSKMIRNIPFISIMMVALFISSNTTYAGTTGKISGIVEDKESGEPLAGVNIFLEGTNLGAASDLNGFYVILNVPAGPQTVKATYIGYTEMIVQNVAISPDHTSRVNFQFEPTVLELGESIVVTAEQKLIRKDETNTVTIRTAQEIQKLPIGDVNDLLLTTVGTVSLYGDIHIRGGRSDETIYVVDGVVQNELLYGTTRTRINPKAIEEFQVQNGGFNAEYGNVMSGLVMITTKSGRPYYQFTAEAISDMFLPQDNDNWGAYSYGYQDYNFTLGGPLIPGFKKLTFFASYQRLLLGDRDPRLYWADGKTYTFEAPYTQWTPDHVPIRDTLTVTLDKNMKPGSWENQHNLNVKLRYNLSNTMDIQVSGLITDVKYQYPSNTSVLLINARHAPRTESLTKSFQLFFTHMFKPTSFYTLNLGYYDSFWERGDGVFFNEPLKIGDPAYNEFVQLNPETNQPDTGTVVESSIARCWDGRSSYYKRYEKRNQETYSFDFDLSHQHGKNHLIKLGGELRYHTIRWYRLRGHLAMLAFFDYKEFTGSNEDWYYHYQKNTYQSFVGYDFYGNQVNQGDWFVEDDSCFVYGRPEAPKHPIIAALYLQDKIEFNDLIVNVGLRFDYFNPNDWQFKDLYHPFSSGGDPDKFDEPDIIDSEVQTYFSPRLGLAFPIRESTVFHAQYGKFSQIPTLIDMYESKNFVESALVGRGGWLNNPNLKSPRTTAYELGVKQRLGGIAAINLTGYYKEIAELVFWQPLNTDIRTQMIDQNIDFGTVKGLELSLQLRRYHNISSFVNYTLSYAVGTGSYNYQITQLVWLKGHPKMTMALDYDRRHTCVINLDWRLGENKGPAVGNLHPLENFGVNLMLTFNSGLPFTKIRVVSEPFTGGGTQDYPLSALNANYSPFNKMIDLKIDKTFHLPFVKGNLNVYLWILNVMNFENVLHVYPFTGTADNNGWLECPDGKLWQREISDPMEIELYKKRMKDPFNYGPPRQIRLGLRFEI